MSAVPVEFHRDFSACANSGTRPFSPPCLGPGNEANVVVYGGHLITESPTGSCETTEVVSVKGEATAK